MRPTFDGRAQVVVGDATTHGGTVLTGSRTFSVAGKAVVRAGDSVYCPQCRPHFFRVAEGLRHCTDTAARLPLAMEGHLTTCGAALLAVPAGPCARGAALAAYGEPPSRSGLTFDLRFVVRDRSTGEPMTDVPYRIDLETGEHVEGTTDEAGRNG